MECRALSDSYRSEIDALWQRYQAFIYILLDDAKAAGVMRRDVDNRYLYTSLMDMLNWSVLWYRPGSTYDVQALDLIFSSIYLVGAMTPAVKASWQACDPFAASPTLLRSVTAPPQVSLKEGHTKLLDCACQIFARKGYFGTSMREIAALTGVQKATLYHYVSGKEDLIYQISRAAIEHISSGVQIALGGVTDPLERVHVFITTHVVCLLKHQIWHACANDELHALSADRRVEIVRLRDGYEDLLRGLIEQAQAAGSLRSDIPAKLLGLVVLGMLNCIYPWYSPTTDLSPVELGCILSDLFLTGTRTRGVATPQTL
jgi:AcrR family transcriptional regulator